jgi:hypothetical protein
MGNLNAKVGDRHKTIDLEQVFRKNGKHFVEFNGVQELIVEGTMKHHKLKWVSMDHWTQNCLKINAIKKKIDEH